LKDGGSLKNVSAKELPMYERSRSFVRKSNGDSNDFTSTITLVKDFYFENPQVFESLGLSGLKEEDFVFVPKMERVAVNIQNLTSEVCDYIRSGGKLYGVKAKSYPFFERARSYVRFYTDSDDINIEQAIDEVKKYYFSSVAPSESEEERLTENDFLYMSMMDYEKAKTRESSIAKMYELALASADEMGDVGKARHNPDWSTTLSALECGLTSLEFVALMFPTDSGMHIKKGRVHTEKFTLIGKDLDAFVQKFGEKNLIANIKKHDTVLYLRLCNLATFFPEGSISLGELMDFYGYKDVDCDWAFGSSIEESDVIEELRLVYADAVRRYLENGGSLEHFDMRAINKMMDLRGQKVNLYQNLYKLALRKGIGLSDYINGKEISLYDAIEQDNGEIVARKRRVKDVEILPLSYEIGLGESKHSKIVTIKGKEYTHYLRQKLEKLMQESEIMNNPEAPKEMKINERFRLAEIVIEQAVAESGNEDALAGIENPNASW
jgi:hypothetical protein